MIVATGKINRGAFAACASRARETRREKSIRRLI